MVISCSLNISKFQPLVPRLRVVLNYLVRRASSIINSDFVTETYISCVNNIDNIVKISMNSLISRDIITMVNVSMAITSL